MGAIDGGENSPTARPVPEYMHRVGMRLLAETRDAFISRFGGDRGVAHSFGVWVLEVEAMARGKKAEVSKAVGNALPTFVNVDLNAEQRAEFKALVLTDAEILAGLYELVGAGIRVGVTFSGEQQSFIVSLTGREGSGPNEGLCMTSFAGELPKALALAWYKHRFVCEGVWRTPDDEAFGDFG